MDGLNLKKEIYGDVVRQESPKLQDDHDSADVNNSQKMKTNQDCRMILEGFFGFFFKKIIYFLKLKPKIK